MSSVNNLKEIFFVKAMIILRRRKYSINDIHIILKRQENKSDILQQHLELLQCIICYCSNVRLQGYDL